MCLDRNCSGGSAYCGALFSRLSALSSVTPGFAVEHAIRSGQFQEPSLVWYFRSRVKGFLTLLNKRRAVEFMSSPGSRFIVLPTPIAGTLFANPPQSWGFFTVSGFNIAKGKRVDLTLVLKPE